MKILKKWLLGNGRGNFRADVLWNFLSGMGYSLQSAVLVLIVARSNGLHDAGAFSIAYTVTQMMATIGSYGMRGFQVSDCKDEYPFSAYFSSRIITVLGMVCICMAYCWKHGYGMHKVALAIPLCLYRALEGMEDVMHGEMQKAGKLSTGAKIEAARMLMSTAAFAACCFITRNAIVASVALVSCAFIFMAALNMLVLGDFPKISLAWEPAGVGRLLLDCLPVCAGGFLYNYLVNVPKYAIEHNLSDELQAVFSILFMPIFAINLLSGFLYKPLITNMGILWEEREIKRFLGMAGRQFCFIAALTAAAAISGAAVGLDLLGAIYGVGLSAYRGLFALLLIFGGLAASDAFLLVALTVIRKQQWAIVAYMLAVFCAWASMDKAVCAFGLLGAGILYGAMTGIVMLVLLSVFLGTVYAACKNNPCLAVDGCGLSIRRKERDVHDRDREENIQ